MDDSKQSRYDSERLIQLATIANEISRASGLSSHGVIKRLVMAVESGELTSDLYPPFQKWRHGGKPERVEVPISNGADQWRSIAKQSASLHQSDKDEFNHPNTASTYHVLADDLFEYSKVCSIGALTKQALRELAIRHNPELVTTPESVALVPSVDSHSVEHDALVLPGSNVPETKEQRQDRRLSACKTAGLVMPKSSAGRLPDGVGKVAGSEGLTRQAFTDDVKAALKRRESAKREGTTVHRA